MALTNEIGTVTPRVRVLKHAYKTDATGNLISLLTGVTGKRIKVWRLFVTCAAVAKSCQVLSGANPFTTLFGQSHELKSSGGVPVFTCNAAEDFKVDPSDATAWHYYIVYSVE